MIEMISKGEAVMRGVLVTLVAALVASAALAQTKEPVLLRDMGSFHVGGRVIEISGQPIKEVVFTPGGVPAKVDPNGAYQIEQMYVQYFLPQSRKGKLPLLMWHGGGLSGVTYETKPDGGEGWLTMFIRRVGTSTSPTRSSAAAPAGPIPSRASRCFCRKATPGSASVSGRPAHGATTRPSVRPTRARNSRSMPTSSS